MTKTTRMKKRKMGRKKRTEPTTMQQGWMRHMVWTTIYMTTKMKRTDLKIVCLSHTVVVVADDIVDINNNISYSTGMMQ